MKNWFKNLFKATKPKATRQGTKFSWINGNWIEVCDFCGGNCGQCGWSIGMGISASMDDIIKNLQR